MIYFTQLDFIIKNYYFNVIYILFLLFWRVLKFFLPLHTKLFKNSILKTCKEKKKKYWLFVGSKPRHFD